MTDASFEDGAFTGQPVRLAVEDAEDVAIASALIQDAVALTGETSWLPKRRRLALMMNRFRWEDRDAADKADRAYERVRTALVIDSVQAVRARGVDPSDKEQIISILAMTYAPADEIGGTVTLTLAGDGEISADVECLDIRIMDLTQPWQASSGNAPDHAIEE